MLLEARKSVIIKRHDDTMCIRQGVLYEKRHNMTLDIYQRIAVHNSSAKYANLSADIANEDRFCLWPAWHGRATVYRLLVCCCFGAVAVCYRIKPAN